MAEEEDTVPSPPSCPPQTTTLSKFLISLLPIILQVIAWTCAFSAVSYAISSAISFTYQVLSLKTANFLVILCTLSVLLLSRNNNDHNNDEEETENIAITILFRDQHIQYVQQHAQASHNSTSNRVGNSRMFGSRVFACCADLRQESPWLTSNERWRSYSNTHLNDNFDQPHYGRIKRDGKEVVRRPLPPPLPPSYLLPPITLYGKDEKKEDGSVDSVTKRFRDASRMNRRPMVKFRMLRGRRIKLRLGKRKDAENEVAPSIESGADQKRSRALSLGTEPDIGNIQQEPMQSGTLSSLRQTDWPSEMSPEARAQTQRILMQGGTGLTTPPEHQEWEISTEIYLMDNEFSELPENLSCPVLKALFLNRNSRLRKIPESFFNNMPALHILNISRTRIKSLPKSLFRLINLKRLFLNHCELLMKLQPEIGQLTNLEILDLEGTRITNLPKEIQHLTALTCLKLSFDDPVNHRKELLNVVIPGGVLSALAQLEELLIDVSPDDKRWNACVIAVAPEVCGLTKLNTLKFYFPQVELLSHFDWSNPEGESLSLSHFRLTVGHHIKRIMSQTPHDMELEMEQYDRCLKYVNGAGIPEEIKMVLQYATAFFLDRHTDIKTLTELGCENLMQLNWCMVGECNEVRAIINGDQMGSCSSSEKNIGLTALEYLHIYRMKNLRSIWEGHILDNGFTSLKTLTLRTCPQLTTICTPELLTSFSNLEELLVDDCPVITSLVSCDNSEYEATHFLPKLKKVSLQYLPALASISNTDGISMPPTVEWMSVYCCPNLLRLPIHKGYHTSLRKIKGERSWWEALEWTSTQQHSWDDIFVPINACD